MSAFEHLMSPGRIGGMELRNRIFMTPMGSNTADDEGYCGERLRQYYGARAEGGAALLIMGSVAISWPVGSANWRQVAISDERFIPGLKSVADVVHGHGAKLAVQLQHAGLTAMNDIRDGRPMLTPSVPKEKEGDMGPCLFPEEAAAMSTPYANPHARVAYQVATEEDIAWLIGQFADAADRAQRAGIDAVELHAGHGYVIHSFLNPSVNQRTDRWGGTLENRARLLVEVIRAIKQRCGSDYPVWCRIDGIEFLTEGGITHEDAKDTARMAEAAGADAIHVSSYADASKGESFTTAHTTHTPCGFVDYAAGIKAVVRIPVITAGRIEPEVGDRLIRQGRIDFVTMGRKLLADPELPRKIREGRAQRDPPLHLLLHLHQPDLREPQRDLRGERAHRARVRDRDHAGRAPAAHPDRRRWSRRHGGRACRAAARACRDALRQGLAARRHGVLQCGLVSPERRPGALSGRRDEPARRRCAAEHRGHAAS